MINKHYYEVCQEAGLASDQTSAVEQIVDMVREIWSDNGYAELLQMLDTVHHEVHFVKGGEPKVIVDIHKIYVAVMALYQTTGATVVKLGAGEGEYKISLNTL